MATSSSSASSAPSAATFRAKTNYMKSWRPRNPPSNRDRLELYALHKQSLAGDAPSTETDPPHSSVADKAKLAAWRNKRGLSKGEAMARYVDECDRQLRVYGNVNTNASAVRSSDDGDGASLHSYSQQGGQQQQQQQMQQPPPPPPAGGTMKGGEASYTSTASSQRSQTTPPTRTTQSGTSTTNSNANSGSNTPQNTPARERENNHSNNNNRGGSGDGNSTLLCPRGLAAIPLLCAAASESRSAYLARLQVTHPSNGWWAKQEPLCLEVNNPLSIPEKLILASAGKIEQLSLIVSEYMGEGHAVSIMSPRVLQAFLWPVHNVFLCCWITLILTTTCLGSMVIMCQTLLFGAKRTNAPLGRLFMEEIHPAARAVESLCEEHQVIGVRVSGLALMPLMMLCDMATSIVGKVGILLGSLIFVGMGVCSWWYWICVLPWLAVCGLCLAVMSGWCFGLIELAGN